MAFLFRVRSCTTTECRSALGRCDVAPRSTLATDDRYGVKFTRILVPSSSLFPGLLFPHELTFGPFALWRGRALHTALTLRTRRATFSPAAWRNCDYDDLNRCSTHAPEGLLEHTLPPFCLSGFIALGLLQTGCISCRADADHALARDALWRDPRCMLHIEVGELV